MPTNGDIDLTNCDREPIHVPGAIQPHGRLLAYDIAALTLRQWSANIAAIHGEVPAGGASLDRAFGRATVARFREIAAATPGIVHPLRAEFFEGDKPRPVMAAAHVWQDMLIVEIEGSAPADGGPASDVLSLPLRVNLANQRMHAASDETEVAAVIAEEVRAISGYDRVMVYRFLERGHGAVVGESRQPHLESFLGLHYPATDIPEPARRLYILNPVRAIGDIHAQPTPLVAAGPMPPLDLSFSVFRAVSPIHIEYLQNMGVAASMSISILQEGELWGLIACHHYAPRFLNLEQRAVCETLGTMAGSYVTLRAKESANAQRIQRHKTFADSLHQVAASSSFADALEMVGPDLRNVVEADGLAIQWSPSVSRIGEAPADEVVGRVCALAADAESGIWSTESLAEALPDLADSVGESCGCLAISLSTMDLAGIAFFRREYAHEVRWAGEPTKITQQTDEGVKLSPRRSFAEWKESVRGRSRSWSAVDLAMAEEVRSGMLETLGRRAAELSRVNDELHRLNADLDSFAYAASHDLREPLRGLNQVVYLLEEELSGDTLEAIAPRLESLRRLTGRMDELVDGLLRLSRAGSGDLEVTDVRLDEVVQEAAELVFGQPIRSDIDLSAPPSVVVSADYLCLRELLTNLLQNGAKYNQQPMKSLEVGVDAERARTREGRPAPAIFVRDNGIGIAREKLGEVFQIFRRLHMPKDFGGGSGAGLTIAKKIAERHGGTIWIESAPGEGTTVYFTLQESVIRQPSDHGHEKRSP